MMNKLGRNTFQVYHNCFFRFKKQKNLQHIFITLLVRFLHQSYKFPHTCHILYFLGRQISKIYKIHRVMPELEITPRKPNFVEIHDLVTTIMHLESKTGAARGPRLSKFVLLW